MRKFIAMFLVFSILALSGNLFAKERKGAELIIQKTDGTQVRGELIAVKQNSLLLLERKSGADVTVNVDDIGVIIIMKKSKLLMGAGLGLLAGAGIGSLLVLAAGPFAFFGGILGGVIIGAGLGHTAGQDETIQVEGKSDSEIKWHLEKLRKKARIRNYQ